MIFIVTTVKEDGENQTVFPIQYDSLSLFLNHHERLCSANIGINETFELANRTFCVKDYFEEEQYLAPIVQSLNQWIRFWGIKEKEDMSEYHNF